jgi:hypothetical protein
MPEILCVTYLSTSPRTPSSYCILSCQTLHQSYISLHSTPFLPIIPFFLCPIFPHHFVPIPLFPSISYLSLPHPSISFPTPPSFHPSPTCPSPLAEPSSIWPPPHHPVFELRPIPSTSSFLILSSLL